MKNWDADHPKAGLMARKRASILLAARQAFLRLGYEGASMEAIAAAADVSIMTLYRHARSKDELFAAVIVGACDYGDGNEAPHLERLLERPLGEILVFAGVECQRRLVHPDSLALMRVVMAASERFPELGEAAYRGFVGHWEGVVQKVLAHDEGSRSLGEADRRELSRAFVDGLFGTDAIRALLTSAPPLPKSGDAVPRGPRTDWSRRSAPRGDPTGRVDAARSPRPRKAASIGSVPVSSARRRRAVTSEPGSRRLPSSAPDRPRWRRAPPEPRSSST